MKLKARKSESDFNSTSRTSQIGRSAIKKPTTNASGLCCQACHAWPLTNAAMPRVVPHDGHGYPVIHLNGHSVNAATPR